MGLKLIRLFLLFMLVSIVLMIISLPFFWAKADTLKPSPEQVNKTWFVQYWSDNTHVIEVDDTVTDIGRVEISDENGKFVACSRFMLTKNWDGFVLAPIDNGFMFTGDKTKLKVELFGEAKRRTTITLKATDPTE